MTIARLPDLEERVLAAAIQARVLGKSDSVTLGDYEIVRKIGSGGMGVVYMARDQKLGVLIALKTIRNITPDAFAQLKHEFRVAADLNHTNLVALYDLGLHADIPYFTMEFIDGVDIVTTLRQQIARASHFAAFDGGSTIRQLLAGIAFLHARGKCHRDLKPTNVLATPEGRVVVLDFGIAHDPQLPGQLATRKVVGTPLYMSPEQAQGQPPSVESDCYSLGLIILEAFLSPGALDQVIAELQDRGEGSLFELLRGVTLPPLLAEICEGFLTRDPALRLTARRALLRLTDDCAVSSVRGRVRPNLLGRAPELALLQRAFQAAEQGPAVVLLGGNAGVGKTTLVQHFLESLDPLVLRFSGRCFERDAMPFKALDTLVEVVAKHLRNLPLEVGAGYTPRYVHALTTLFPCLATVPAFRPALLQARLPKDEQETRSQAFFAFHMLLGRLGDQQRIVLWIDDLQWGDLDSIALLSEALRATNPARILLIATYRSDRANRSSAVESLLALADTHPHVQWRTATLGPLSDSDSLRLANVLLPEASTEHQEEVVRLAEGNPFLLREIAQYSRASGAPEGVPRSGLLEAMIEKRLATVPPQAKDLLKLVAVARSPVDLSIALSAAGVTGDSRLLLHRLRADNWVRLHFGERETIDVYHDRIGEAIIAGFDAQELEAWHLQLAIAIETAERSDAEALAWHFSRAGHPERATVHALTAAEQAIRGGAFENAIRLLKLGLEHVTGNTRGPLDRRLGDALRLAGRCREAAAQYLAAAANAPLEQREDLELSAALQYLHAGQLNAAEHLLDRLLPLHGLQLAKSPVVALALLPYYRARIRLKLRTSMRTIQELSNGQTPPVRTHDLARIDWCWGIASALITSDHLRGTVVQAQGLLIALSANEPARLARALALEAAAVSVVGPKGRAKAEQLLEHAQSLAFRAKDPYAIALVALMTGSSAHLLGDTEGAVVRMDQAEQLLRNTCVGVAWDISHAHLIGLNALMGLGRLSEYRAKAMAAMAEAKERGNVYYTVLLRNFTSVVRLMNDDPEGVLEETSAVERDWEAKGFHIHHVTLMHGPARRSIYLGRGVEAHERIEKTWPRVRSSFLPRVANLRLEFLSWRARCAAAAFVESRKQEHARIARHLIGQLLKVDYPGAKGVARSLEGIIAFVNGDHQGALQALSLAKASLDREGRATISAAVGVGLGCVRGGEEGAELVRTSLDFFGKQGIKDPVKFVNHLLPGFLGIHALPP